MQDESEPTSYSLFDPPVLLAEAPEGAEGSEIDELAATLLLTGATGLIGSHVATLFRDMGWNVRALVRPSSDVRYLEQLGCDFVLGDLTLPGTVDGAASGCEAVIHAAAQLGEPAPLERHVEVNVEGTRRVLKESIRAGVRRFVHISSVAVYGEPASGFRVPIAEDAPLDQPISTEEPYALTKRMAEEVVHKAGDRIEWCVLRPDMVMGERDRLFTPRIMRWASRPVLVTLGSGENDLPLVYAGNVALAAYLGATHERAAWRTYNVTDDGGLTQRTLVRIASGKGPDAPVLSIPLPIAVSAARLVRGLGRVLPGVGRGPLTPRRIRLFAESDPYACELIEAELGWKPTVTTEEGWRRAVEWFRASAGRPPPTTEA